MAVQVLMPQQKQVQKEEDPLDKILKGLQIAHYAFGIKGALDQADQLKSAQAMKQKEFSADLASKGLMEEDGKYVPDPNSLLYRIKESDLNRKASESAYKEKEFGLKEQLMNIKQEQLNNQKQMQEFNKNSLNFKALPEDQKIMIDKLTAEKAKLTPIVDQFDQYLKQLDNPDINENQKLQVARQSLKLMNSPLNPDAVGAEEVKRLSSFLTPGPDPFGPKGFKVGIDIEGFKDAIRNSRERIGGTLSNVSNQIDSLMGRKIQETANINTNQKKPMSLENPFLPKANANQNMLDVGFIQNGYRYLGGDPKSKNSWEKVK